MPSTILRGATGATEVWENWNLGMGSTGKFITFEGIDGCGKTTQMRILAAALRAEGWDVVETVEPGGTDIGRLIRKILLDPASKDLTSRAELLLYFASRAQNVEQVIRPALAAGSIVLCDRFTDSTLAYQGHGRGLDQETILSLDRIACRGLEPGVTILIDIDVETSRDRTRVRNEREGSGETRLDDESAAFHGRVRKGYRAIAEENPSRLVTIDGTGQVSAVARRVREALRQYV
jgi:dTMP kinase